jgi:sulfhydrogenase subunit delta
VAGAERPRLGVFKFASCDGCQLSLLDLEDELLAITSAIEIADFREASSRVLEGSFDLALVEGSVTTPEDKERVLEVRSRSRVVVSIGACATAGGIQALRNFGDVAEFLQAVYAKPEYIATLSTSSPIAAHIKVDFELRGCPINKRQLLEVVSAHLSGRKPNVPTESVCEECKRRGTVCVLVARGTPCLGPLTQSGCGAICPAYHRGCYGCFGPQDTPNPTSWAHHLIHMGASPIELKRTLRTFNVSAPAFVEAAAAIPEEGEGGGG